MNRNLRSMAIVQSPNSKSAPKENRKKRKNTVTNTNTNTNTVVDVDETKPEMKSDSQPPKRNKNPGVRVIGSRIYDSENGTTCHQCRQKTHAVYAACTNQVKNKPCPLKYCHTCLLNRYGEKTEDVVLLDKWDCPKCKGVCNCSICMKKRGHQPTGMVVQMAKAGGFTSVSDMIHVKGAQNVSNYKRVKETTASPRKLVSPTKLIMITSPKKPGKENLFDGNMDSNSNPVLLVSPLVEEKPKKKKRKASEVNNEESKVVDVSATDIEQAVNKSKKKSKAKESKEIVGGDITTYAIEKVDGNVIIPKTKETKAKKGKGLKEIVGGDVSTDAIEKVDGNVIISKTKGTKAKKGKGLKEIVGGDVSSDAIEKVDGNVIIPKTKETKAKKGKGLKEIVGGDVSIDAIEKVDGNVIIPKIKETKAKKGKGLKEIVGGDVSTDAVEKVDGNVIIHKTKETKAKKGKGLKEIVGGDVSSDAVEKVDGNVIIPKTKEMKAKKGKGLKEVVGGDVSSDAIEKVDGNVIIPKTKETKTKKGKGLKDIVGGDVSTDVVEKVEGNVIIPKTKETKAKKGKGLKEIVVEKLSTGAVVKVNDVQQVEKDNKKSVDDGKEIIHENKKPKAKKVKGSTGAVGETVITGATEKVNGVQQPKNDIKNKIQEGGVVLDDKCDKKANQCLDDNKSLKVKRNGMNLCSNLFEAVIPLPTGTDLVNIAGADLPKEDAGNALQLLEFCSTFGKVLDVKKGQAEAVLRELIQGRSTRRGKFTSVIQFHIKLLSVIQEETESESESESDSETPVLDQTPGNDSWLKVLKSRISNTQNILENMDCLDKAGGYDDLDSSTKLRILVFLCDEVLGTEKIRNWIDDQNAKFKEKKKEAKKKLFAAKDKEKSLKQKMIDDIATAIIANEGIPLTLKEHDAIISKIKNQAEEAHAEMLACKGMVPIETEKADAVRTKPFFSDKNGHVYWKLKGCYDKPGILLQDIGNADHTVSVVDKWFEYDAEQVDLIEKHIHVLRSRYRKVYKK